MSKSVKGYKVFNSDWTCRGFKYEVGKTYKEDVDPKLCNRGFHFCEKIADCFNYYIFDANNKIAEVEAVGVTVTGDDKSATNEIVIVREVTWEEMLKLANTGKGNAGRSNSGDCNSGDSNSGNSNSGNRNSGNSNSGNSNSGDRNSGNRNSGDRNSGNRNSGYSNSGYRNSGDRNSGNRNSGNSNSGYRNSGNSNSGDWNSGNRNSGNSNSGYRNSGNSNSGDWNTGDFNLSDSNTGCFCMEEKTIEMFDNPTDMTMQQWRRSDAYRLLMNIKYVPNTWVWLEDMTEQEKTDNKDCEILGGYLRKNDLTKVNQKWWDELTNNSRQIIKEIPNFDADKFQKIMGIKI